MKFMPRSFPALAQALLMAAALMLAGAFAGTVGAQPASRSDPPGRVARLSDLSGQVWLYSPDSGEWVSAVRNRPLTTGDRLATETGARAELQVGSTTLRLAAGTELEVRNLDDDHVSLQLHNGSVSARLRETAEAAEFELSTEDGRFLVPRAGRYRFDRDASGSFATVYAGQARYEGPNSGLTITSGQRAEFWIDAAGAAQYRLGELQSDAFTVWNTERDRDAERSAPARYVSPAMTGAEDLDRYGRWEQDPDYGALWIPRGVAVDWAPYSTGHWAWVRPWGWTWVDDAPWGFAPFHYGRWVHRRDNWGWAPGQRVERPVYAPALVAWVGGPGVSVSISIGAGRAPAPVVGWFPLAPREVYVPSYQASPRYTQNINITHVTNITQITNVINNPQAPREFDNRRFPNAVTVVPAAVMTGRQPVAPAAAQLRDAPWVRDIAKQPAGGTVQISAPVTAPVAPARSPEARPVKPAPGAASLPGVMPPGARPNMPPRDREGARPAPPASTAPGAAPNERRPGSQNEEGRPVGPGQRLPVPVPVPMPVAPAPLSGPAVTPSRPALVPPAPVVAPTVRPAPDAVTRPGPSAQPPPPIVPPRPAPSREGGVPAETPSAPPVLRPANPPPAAPPRPAPPREIVERPAPPQAVQEAPLMRPLPVQRGEERRPPPRPEAPAVAAPRPPVPAERPVPPPRAAEVVRPAAPVAPPPAAPAPVRPTEVPKPPPPEVKKVEAPPHPRVEPPKDVREGKREGKGEGKGEEKRVEPRER